MASWWVGGLCLGLILLSVRTVIRMVVAMCALTCRIRNLEMEILKWTICKCCHKHIKGVGGCLNEKEKESRGVDGRIRGRAVGIGAQVCRLELT